MKTKKLNIILLVLLLICTAIGCHSRQKPDIRPHPVNLSADSFYQQAVAILQSSYDVDSTRKCISLLDRALSIDSLNPDYYGTKAKLLAEIGELDSALHVQTLAMERKAITGEYLFQLGLFQAAKDMNADAHQSYEKMLEQPREMGEMTLKDFVPMSLRCQMRSNRKSGKCKEKQNIAGERFANHYPRRCKI